MYYEYHLIRWMRSALGCCLQTMTSPSDKLDSSSLKPSMRIECSSQSIEVSKVTLNPATLCSLKPILAGLSIVESVLGSSPSLGRL